jgi:hypothetical protein
MDYIASMQQKYIQEGPERMQVIIALLLHDLFRRGFFNLKYHVTILCSTLLYSTCQIPILAPEALKTSEKYNANLRTFVSKYHEIKSKYRGEFIAIFDGQIIGDTNHQSLLGKIREKVEDKDIDSVFETYISKTDDILIT